MPQVLDVSDPDLIRTLDQMSPAKLDELPFGIIRVDDHGDILYYSAFEANLLQVEIRSALGKNFFRDVAPCTSDPHFEGRFEEGVRNGNLDVFFRFTFSGDRVPDAKPMNVMIHMAKAALGPHHYIIVKRL